MNGLSGVFLVRPFLPLGESGGGRFSGSASDHNRSQ